MQDKAPDITKLFCTKLTPLEIAGEARYGILDPGGNAMTDNTIGQFITNIMNILERNGFPEKKVSLPLEKLYEDAYKKGFSFNKVLEFLKEKGIDNEKTPEKVIFSPTEPETVVEAQPTEDSPNSSSSSEESGNMFADMLKSFDPEMLKNVDLSQMMTMAKSMPPPTSKQKPD